MNLENYAVSQYYTRSNAPECNDIGYVYFRIYKRQQILKLAELVMRAPQPTPAGGHRLLDLGCGDGSDLDYLLRWTASDALRGGEVHLFDVDGPAIDLATRRFTDLGFETTAAKGNLADPLPYEDAFFDLVLCSEVIEHMEDPESLLRQIVRVLRPGGHLVLTTDNEPTAQSKLKNLLKRLVGRYQRSESYAFRQLGAKTALHRFEQNGREVVVYGHINTRTTSEWESACSAVGLRVIGYGTYGSVRRHTHGKSIGYFAAFFMMNFVNSLLPRAIAKHFGATTLLLIERP